MTIVLKIVKYLDYNTTLIFKEILRIIYHPINIKCTRNLIIFLIYK